MSTSDHEAQTVRAVQAAQTALLSALLLTHPEPQKLSAAIDQALGRLMETTPSASLSAEAAEQARFYVEWLQEMLPVNKRQAT